jgi:hypothetical protein
VRAGHAHAAYQSGRHPSLHALGDMLRAAVDRIETRQEAVSHFGDVEEHIRKHP